MLKRKKKSESLLPLLFLLVVVVISVFIAQFSATPSRTHASETPYSNALKLLNTTNNIPTLVEIPVNINTDAWPDVWTIEGWFKPENINPTVMSQYLFFAPVRDDYSSYSGTGLYIQSNQLYAGYLTPLTQGVLNAGTITNEWHHIAFVNDSHNCKLFVDGIMKASTVNNECFNGYTVQQKLFENITIGAKQGKRLSGGIYVKRAEWGFIGQIDEFRLTFSVPTYTSNFTRPDGPFPPTTGDWLYRFDAITPENSFQSFGFRQASAKMVNTAYQVLQSTVPYIAPTSTNTPTTTPTNSPTSTPKNTPTITPTPGDGCYFRQVQCVRAPCDPILICPTATPTPISCVNLCGNGTCEEMTCQGTGCACPESVASCPSDCKGITATPTQPSPTRYEYRPPSSIPYYYRPTPTPIRYYRPTPTPIRYPWYYRFRWY